MKKLLAVCVSTSLQGLAIAASPPAGVSHCTSTERVVFSCQLDNEKVVSFCASPRLDAANGYLQYRYGFLNGQLELVFPPSLSKPRGVFNTQFLMLAYNSVGTLSFNNAGYEYMLADEAGKGVDLPRLSVSRFGTVDVLHKCVDKIVGGLTLDFHNELVEAGAEPLK